MALTATNKSFVISKSKPKYHINLQNFLRIPANVYWKDINGTHLGCNDRAAEDTGLCSPNEYVGLTIFDISKKENALTIDKADKAVIKSCKQNCLIESSGALHTQHGIYFSIKSPLFNLQGKAAGLFGISFKLFDFNLPKIAHSLKAICIPDGFKIIGDAFFKYYSSAAILESASLTKRESAVMVHLCQGKSAKRIGNVLGISERTVETHIERIKMKTDCKTKYELIEKFLLLSGVSQ